MFELEGFKDVPDMMVDAVDKVHHQIDYVPDENGNLVPSCFGVKLRPVKSRLFCNEFGEYYYYWVCGDKVVVFGEVEDERLEAAKIKLENRSCKSVYFNPVFDWKSILSIASNKSLRLSN